MMIDGTQEGGKGSFISSLLVKPHPRSLCFKQTNTGDADEYRKLLQTTMVVLPRSSPSPPPLLSLSRVLSQEEVRPSSFSH